MQLRPLLTSACGSPCVAITRLSFTATTTPQPVPQKRHGAFDHLTRGSVAAAPGPCAGSATPAAAAAAEAADSLTKSRLSIGIWNLLVHRGQAVSALVHQRRRQHAVDALNGR